MTIRATRIEDEDQASAGAPSQGRQGIAVRLDPRILDRLETEIAQTRNDYALSLQAQIDLLFARLRSVGRSETTAIGAMLALTQTMARQAESFGFLAIARLAASLSDLMSVCTRNPEIAMDIARAHLECMYDALEENRSETEIIDQILALERQVGAFGAE